jgi:aldehyde dehydrogenase
MPTTISNAAEIVSRPVFKAQYENFIGGEWVAPANGQYFDNTSPVDGASFTRIPRSTKEDIDEAVAAAWKAAKTWNRTAPRRAGQYAQQDC